MPLAFAAATQHVTESERECLSFRTNWKLAYDEQMIFFFLHNRKQQFVQDIYLCRPYQLDEQMHNALVRVGLNVYGCMCVCLCACVRVCVCAVLMCVCACAYVRESDCTYRRAINDLRDKLKEHTRRHTQTHADATHVHVRA